MHESALARAALPAPTRCLGRELLPYSLGHELWLIRENNPVLRGGLEGLPGAVFICSRTWTELLEVRSHRWLALDMALWRWRIRARLSTFDAQLSIFLAYRNEGLLEFPISTIVRPDRGPSQRLPGTPFILRLQQWLMETLGKSEAQAWDYPVGLAKMRWAAHWEAQGGVDVYNAHDAEFDAYVAEQEAKECRASSVQRPEPSTLDPRPSTHLD
jgi:hypothetical protein